jgi:hypothetical protein
VVVALAVDLLLVGIDAGAVRLPRNGDLGRLLAAADAVPLQVERVDDAQLAVRVGAELPR